MVKRRVPEPPATVVPGLRRLFPRRGARPQHRSHALQADLHQARVAAGAPALVGDPDRPGIAIREAVRGQAAGAGALERHAVNLPRILVEDEIGDAVDAEQAVKPAGEGGAVVVEPVQRPRPAPLGLVGTVEGDAVDAGAALRQRPRQPPEERPVRPLQEQEDPAACIDHPGTLGPRDWALALRGPLAACPPCGLGRHRP